MRAHAVRWGGAFVSTLSLWFRRLAMLALSLWRGERGTRLGGLCTPCNPLGVFVAWHRGELRTRWGGLVWPLPGGPLKLWAAVVLAVGGPLVWGPLRLRAGTWGAPLPAHAVVGRGLIMRMLLGMMVLPFFWPPLASSGPPHCSGSTPA